MKKKKKQINPEEVVRAVVKTKQWHHDIQKINGEFVESVVKKFQLTKDEPTLAKIIDNYSIFRHTWAKAFAPYLDNDIEAGRIMHDEIIWRSATAFRREKSIKPDGKAFNAYVVSALLNQLKNHRSRKMSHKNHPRVRCPVCAEEVYQIDHKHLKHAFDLERYRRSFQRAPLVSYDGKVICQVTEAMVDEVSEEQINRVAGKYTVADFRKEYRSLLDAEPRCPITGLKVDGAPYPSTVMSDYSMDEFRADHPDFTFDKRTKAKVPGVSEEPLSEEEMLAITQQDLDTRLEKDPNRERILLKDMDEYPWPTFKAKQVDVVNPYTGEKVPEITLGMLHAAGTTWREHLEVHAQIWLGRFYPQVIVCPFTGRKTHCITRANLEELGRTVEEFYQAVCKYPLRKWHVRCALCGGWTSNIWTHLESREHTYAPSMSMQEFEMKFANGNTKVVVTSNSYVENDSGDFVHLADLFGKKLGKEVDLLELEDSLMHVAEDPLDRAIASAVRTAQTLEDILYTASKKRSIRIPKEARSASAKAVKDLVRPRVGVTDFDVALTRKGGWAVVMIPSRETIKKRLARMIESSDL